MLVNVIVAIFASFCVNRVDKFSTSSIVISVLERIFIESVLINLFAVNL